MKSIHVPNWSGPVVAVRCTPACIRLAALVLVILAGGCRGRMDLRHRLESPDPAKRVAAIRSAADQGDATLVPAIVDRLDDEDPAVRLYAILALERLTGTRLDYAYAAPRHVRLRAIEGWRAYVQSTADERASAARTTPPGSGPSQ